MWIDHDAREECALRSWKITVLAIASVRWTFVVVLRLFASAREAAGVNRAVIAGGTVDEVLAAACTEFGSSFAAVLAICRVWVNGEPANGDTPVFDRDEVAVLPPVSGGCGAP